MESDFGSSEDEDIIFVPKTAPNNEDKKGDKMPTKKKKVEKEEISEPEKVERKEPIKDVSTLSKILCLTEIWD